MILSRWCEVFLLIYSRTQTDKEIPIIMPAIVMMAQILLRFKISMIGAGYIAGTDTMAAS